MKSKKEADEIDRHTFTSLFIVPATSPCLGQMVGVIGGVLLDSGDTWWQKVLKFPASCPSELRSPTGTVTGAAGNRPNHICFARHRGQGQICLGLAEVTLPRGAGRWAMAGRRERFGMRERLSELRAVSELLFSKQTSLGSLTFEKPLESRNVSQRVFGEIMRLVELQTHQNANEIAVMLLELIQMANQMVFASDLCKNGF